MHDCLKVAELVDMICSQFGSSSNPGDQRALAALARTCRRFQDPAMDHLWRSTSLGRLLAVCLPSDLWDVEPSEERRLWYRRARLLRPICDLDWQRVRLYAPRIRKLASYSQDSWFLEGILPSLSAAFPPSFLHNLQELRWYHCGDFFSYIQIFLRPSLTRIAFHLTSTSHCSLLPRLAERCPKWADISIAADPDVDLRLLSRFVARLPLPLAETIRVPWLEQDALEHLSKLPMLKSLTMRRLPETLAGSAARIGPAFPALRHLRINGGTLADTTQFLLMCRDVPLETLTVERTARPGYPSAADMHDVFTAVAARVSHSTLRRLHLAGHGYLWHKPDPVIPLIHPKTLVLLLCFENLTSLHLTSPPGFDLDDETVSQMARAWPRIETLCLAGTLPSTSRPRATLASLHSIAWHCPRIVALTMAFDGSAVPSPSTASPRNACLRQLHVLHSPITTPIAMGRCLSGVFPNLDLITTSREDMDNEGYAQLQKHEEAIRHHRCWKEVSDVLRIWRFFPDPGDFIPSFLEDFVSHDSDS
ncbi:hypothetical protein DFH06DRAFT_1327192 [Mycena polygramma]|nr:hypothetical protein DFH06DRAFT_1327192 [Mycena polygramma]